MKKSRLIVALSVLILAILSILLISVLALLPPEVLLASRFANQHAQHDL
jgi:hypothetical protein